MTSSMIKKSFKGLIRKGLEIEGSSSFLPDLKGLMTWFCLFVNSWFLNVTHFDVCETPPFLIYLNLDDSVNPSMTFLIYKKGVGEWGLTTVATFQHCCASSDPNAWIGICYNVFKDW